MVTGDPAAPSGQVMVLDGAHQVDAAHPGFSVPLGGLLAGQVVRVHAVEWTGRGPRFSAFTQPLAAHPAATFPAANAPYLVGVITAAAPLAPSAASCPAPRSPLTREHPAPLTRQCPHPRAHARYNSAWMGYQGRCETHSEGTALI